MDSQLPANPEIPAPPQNVPPTETVVTQIPSPQQTPPVPGATVVPSVPQETVTQPGSHGHGKGKIIFLVLILIFVFLFIVSCITFVMVAYDKLQVGDYALRAGMGEVVMGLPFTPKTPDYVFRRIMKVSPTMKKFSFDFSMAISGIGDDFLGLGTNVLDIAANGAMDITDEKNPLINAKLMVTKDLTADIRVKDKIVYAKLNTLPPSVSMFFTAYGFPESFVSEITDKWVTFDGTTTNTEARTMQDEKKDESTEKIVNEINKQYQEGKLKFNNTLQEEKYGTVQAYKITTILNKLTIDKLERIIKETDPALKRHDLQSRAYSQPLSDVFNEMKIITWVEKDTYYIRKMIISFTVRQDNSSFFNAPMSPVMPVLGASTRNTAVKSVLGVSTSMSPVLPVFSSWTSNNLKQNVLGLNTLVPVPDKRSTSKIVEMPVTIVIKYNDIGKPVNVEVPAGAVRFETFMEQLMRKMQSGYSGYSASPAYALNPTEQYAKARNVVRRSDINAILNATMQYMADNKGALPPGVTTTLQPISKTGADICPILNKRYIAGFPVDPQMGDGKRLTECSANYSTGYFIVQSYDGRISVSAPYAELGEQISMTR